MLRNSEDPRHVFMDAVEAAHLANQMERLDHVGIAAALDAAINNASNSKSESTVILHVQWEGLRGTADSVSDTEHATSTGTTGVH